MPLHISPQGVSPAPDRSMHPRSERGPPSSCHREQTGAIAAEGYESYESYGDCRTIMIHERVLTCTKALVSSNLYTSFPTYLHLGGRRSEHAAVTQVCEPIYISDRLSLTYLDWFATTTIDRLHGTTFTACTTRNGE